MSSLFGIGGGGNVGASGSFYPYLIDQSLRFNGSNTYLSWTPSQAGEDEVWTISLWVKRCNLGSNQGIFSAGADTSNIVQINWQANDSIRVWTEVGGTVRCRGETDAVFRDSSAWYHIVWRYDATAPVTNLYVNGVEQSVTYDTSIASASTVMFSTTNHDLGRRSDNIVYLDSYVAEFHGIDGTALDATSFGETINGVWVPKAYSGSYGTNGFYLSFADSAAIGDDLSGNTNDWTANNLAASDVVPDSPTNNYATFNPLATKLSTIFSEGNTVFNSDDNTSGNADAVSTMVCPLGVDIYAEFKCTAFHGGAGNAGIVIGIIKEDFIREESTETLSQVSGGIFYAGNGSLKVDGSTSGTIEATYTLNDIIGVKVDRTNDEVKFYKNNALQHTVSIDATIQYFFGVTSAYTNSLRGLTYQAMFTETSWTYTPETNYNALSTANLPEVTIGQNSAEQADDYFTTMLHTGTGSQQAVTGAGFAPDLRWTKSRGSAFSHVLHDNVRGETAYLQSNNTNAENTLANMSLDSDGFTVHADDLGDPQVSWLWKAGGTAVSNTDGSITSSVSAAPDAGFSIVSYTGTGANATVGHGLSSAPEMIIVKNRDDTRNWTVYSSPVGNTTALFLNSTSGSATPSTAYWNDTSPTSSVFTVGTTNNVNASGDDIIAYCFHSVDGYSKVGSYVGNGSADGTFVYTGHRVQWVMIKKSSGADGWSIYDSAREPINVMDTRLSANLADAEVSGSNIALDFISNGFKLRGTGTTINTSGQTYIYLAFAEAPFKYANAR